jgi:FkbM family methyltransferase
MLLSPLRHRIERLLEEESPGRFLASRLLWRTGLCRLVTFQMPDGYRMRFHPSAISAALWQDRSFRDDDVEVCRRVLRPGDGYLDVGANVGQLAIVAANRVGPAGSVLALEAHPRTYAFLKENCQLNGLSWVQIRNTAVGDHQGTVAFTDMTLDDQNFVASGGGGSGGVVQVEMQTLDDLVPDRPIRLMKIDVEGFELQVLAGGPRTLSRCGCLYVEESRRNLARFGGTSEQLRQSLKGAGFEVFLYEEGHLSPAPEPTQADGAYNLLAIRPPLIAEIRDSLGQARRDLQSVASTANAMTLP